MVMKGGSGGDEAWARAGDENENGNGNGSGKQAAVREPDNNRRRKRRRRGIAKRIVFTWLRKNGNCALPRHYDNNMVLRALCEGPKLPAGDQQMADIGGSAPANPGGASYGLTRVSSPSGITLGGGDDIGGSDPAPEWIKNLSKQLSDSSYPNFFASSSNSNAPETPQNSSPPSSPPRLRKMARYSSPPPATPLSRASNANVLPPPWATGVGASHFSFQTSTPSLMSPVTSRDPGPEPMSLLTGFHQTPAYISFAAPGAGSSASSSSWMLPPLPGRSSRGASTAVRDRRGAMLNPLGFPFRRSGGEHAGARVEEVVTEKNAEDQEGLELTLGNAETRKDRA